MLIQYFKSSFNFAVFSCDFLNQIRKLLVPVFLGIGLLLSASAKANYEFQSLSHAIDLDSAKIYFSGKKPSSLEGFSDYTIEGLSLHLGNRKYSASNISSSPSVLVSLNDLDLVKSGSKTKLVLTYDLSLGQAVIEAVACWGLPIWSWGACLDKVRRFYWYNQTEELEFSSSTLVSAIDASIQQHNKDKNEFLKNLNNLADFPYKDNANQIERNQFKYIFIKGTQDHVFFNEPYKKISDAVIGFYVHRRIADKLHESDEAFTEVLHAFESIDCNRRLKNQFTNIVNKPPVRAKLNEYVTDICDLNEHSFLKHIAQISPALLDQNGGVSSANAADSGFNPLVFCNKYICEFKLNPGLSYRVVVSKADHMQAIKDNIHSVLHEDITGACQNFCSISDVDALISSFENQSVSWAVSKITPFSLVENNPENYSLRDGDYEISILKPLNIPNSEEILKLSNNQYKVFYWSRANKNVFYKYDPRFFDSRNIVSVPSNHEISAVFNDILNAAKQTDSKIVSLSLLHEEKLDCFSSFSSCMSNQYYKGFTINSGGATVRQLNNAIKNDASVDFIIAGDLIHIPQQGEEYCRIPQKGSNGGLNMPLKKDSEREFIANMRDEVIDLKVICFTVDVSDSDPATRSMMLDHIIERFRYMRSSFNHDREAINYFRGNPAFEYAIDCNPFDATVHVEKNITQCPQPGAKITYFLAIPKEGHPSFFSLLSGQSIKEYLEIAPWGNLKDAVVDRHSMFSDSTIESVQLNTASTKMMNSMFANSNLLENGNFKFWNTSKVTNAYGMFRGASSFNQNIKNWNLSNLQDSSCMFNEALDNFKNKSIVVNDHWHCPNF
jgi:hypothetical protein